jgi:hypothetical protein
MADNQPPSSADVTESGSLNLPEPCGPHRPVMGLVYLFLIQLLSLEMQTLAMELQIFNVGKR